MAISIARTEAGQSLSALDEMGMKSTYDQMEDNANTRLCVGEKAWDSVDGHVT